MPEQKKEMKKEIKKGRGGMNKRGSRKHGKGRGKSKSR